MAKKEKANKEKPLEKMTAKELRDLGLAIEGVVGVNAMNKNELIAAIKQAKGIVDEKGGKKAAVDVRSVKAKIGDLKQKRLQAKESGDKKMADVLRRRISNLKKRTRRAAA